MLAILRGVMHCASSAAQKSAADEMKTVTDWRPRIRAALTAPREERRAKKEAAWHASTRTSSQNPQMTSSASEVARPFVGGSLIWDKGMRQ
jgi:hypothetical protein